MDTFNKSSHISLHFCSKSVAPHLAQSTSISTKSLHVPKRSSSSALLTYTLLTSYLLPSTRNTFLPFYFLLSISSVRPVLTSLFKYACLLTPRHFLFHTRFVHSIYHYLIQKFLSAVTRTFEFPDNADAGVQGPYFENHFFRGISSLRLSLFLI